MRQHWPPSRAREPYFVVGSANSNNCTGIPISKAWNNKPNESIKGILSGMLISRLKCYFRTHKDTQGYAFFVDIPRKRRISGMIIAKYKLLPGLHPE